MSSLTIAKRNMLHGAYLKKIIIIDFIRTTKWKPMNLRHWQYHNMYSCIRSNQAKTNKRKRFAMGSLFKSRKERELVLNFMIELNFKCHKRIFWFFRDYLLFSFYKNYCKWYCNYRCGMASEYFIHGRWRTIFFLWSIFIHRSAIGFRNSEETLKFYAGQQLFLHWAKILLGDTHYVLWIRIC